MQVHMQLTPPQICSLRRLSTCMLACPLGRLFTAHMDSIRSTSTSTHTTGVQADAVDHQADVLAQEG